MEKLNRREFLERSILTLAATSASAVSLKSRAAQNPAAANERLGIALVGAGGRGRDHLSSLLAMPDVELTSICDVDERAAARSIKIVQEKTGNKPRYYQD